MFSSLTFPAAPLAAAVRVLRTAGGRRALQLVLLVGGLFTLGFLCGEQAHAADATPVPTKVTSAWSGATGQESPAGAVRAVTERIAAPVHRVGERAVIPVQRIDAQAVTPVRDVVAAVYRSLEAAVAVPAVEKPRSSAPSLPMPDLAQAPDGLTQVPDAPAHLNPEPKSTAPRPQRHGGAVAPAPAEQKQRHARAQARTAIGAPTPVASYGPEAGPAPQYGARASERHGAAAVGAPGYPSPSGDPAGVLGKQAADVTAFRHGDAHAVTLDHRAPLRLTPGATACVDAPSTRERHRDVPVFPG
jgi:hypothetical protein